MPYPNFMKSLSLVASHADVLRGASSVPAPRGAGTRDEPLRTFAWEAMFLGEAKREAIDMKSYKNISFSVNIGFVLSLVLKGRVFVTRKWPSSR